MTSKNAGAAVFVINYISNGSAKLKAFEGMSFTHSYLFSSSIPTAQMLFMHLAESSLAVTHDWALMVLLCPSTQKERMQLMYQWFPVFYNLDIFLMLSFML